MSVIAIGMALPAAASAQGTGQLGTKEPLEIRAEAYAQEQLLIRGLQAQYTAALLRERKLAVDGDQRKITAAQAGVLKARKQWAAARTEVGPLRHALDEARAGFAQRVQEASLRAQGLELQLHTYRLQSQALVQQASPEKLKALQRFADGDRVGAWPAIHAITQSELKAIDRAASAGKATKLKDLADLRLTMRGRGEATAADARAIFAQWPDLKLLPNAQASLMRADLAARLGDFSLARKAAEQAVQAAAPGSTESSFASVALAQILRNQGDLPGAKKHLLANYNMARNLTIQDTYVNATEVMSVLASTTDGLCVVLREQGDLAEARQFCDLSLSARQTLADQNQNRDGLQLHLASSLITLGDVLRDQGHPKATVTRDEQDLAIHQRLTAQDSRFTSLHRASLASLFRIGILLNASGELARSLEYFEQSLAISQRLVGQDPIDVPVTILMMQNLVALDETRQALEMLGNTYALFLRQHTTSLLLAERDPTSIALKRGRAGGLFDLGVGLELLADLNGARKNFEQALDISRRLGDQDPTQSTVQQDISLVLNKLGDVMKAQGDLAGAREQYEQSLGITQRLAQGDASAAALQTNRYHTLWRLADLTGSQTAWQAVMTQLERMQATGPISPANEVALRTARQIRDTASEP